MRGPWERSGENEEREEETVATRGVPEAEEGSDTDSDAVLKTEGTHGLGELVKDTVHLRSCRAHSLVPASCSLRQGSAPELSLHHRGLGPQGARALASTLTSNPDVKRLDLWDNGLCGASAEALAGALSQAAASVGDVELSENQLGAVGAQAVCAALVVNPVMQRVQLARNSLEEQAPQYLAELLLAHKGLKSLDLSSNKLSDQAGETLGPALVENTGLTELNVSWNHLQGPGGLAFARGLEANIFLRVLDISDNGFGDPGASPVGEALQTNNMLKELNMNNSRISAVGALSLGLGLRVNQTLRILVVSRNPRRSAGCFAVLRSVQESPVSALELLDFSIRDVQVSREFDDLTAQ
ncbi:leucine-rich repeat-containing protein 74B-like [Diceros bicornis minor]|uniref:leucine-rich repeat-containing protein 74B-like n=1 Tax=Diceros bicornis minor TaxID=77932 RepID=UPI0026EEB661|nr:leucine-rich repeat-containing protein 74B-like [Diceros bicornis minor]